MKHLTELNSFSFGWSYHNTVFLQNTLTYLFTISFFLYYFEIIY